jgi:type IV pilus assembly protein PilA
MNNTFKANLIKTLANKKGNKGFTLIELLVVVIIIGVLAAIALPNLLGQVGKARESEAKSQLGAMNRAQQGYFTEYAQFAGTAEQLEVPVGNEKYYVITVENIGTPEDPVGNGQMFAQGHVDDPTTTDVNEIQAATLSNTAIADTLAKAANGKNGTRDYASGISYHVFNRSFATVVCRGVDKPNQYILANPSAAIGGDPGTDVGTPVGDGLAGFVGTDGGSEAVSCEPTGDISVEVK